jgi:hypothetical protein
LGSGFGGTLNRHIAEGLICAVELGALASDRFIAAADDVTVEWVQFDQSRNTTRAFGGQKRRARATKTVCLTSAPHAPTSESTASPLLPNDVNFVRHNGRRHCPYRNQFAFV